MNKLLSLCMIVKNEEKVLRGCLDSIKGLIDEIIIIDTGSTDQTKQIASEYTKHVYEFTWNNDFAAARNESIRRATGKWVLIMDADEFLDSKEFIQLKQLLLKLDHSKAHSLIVSIFSFLGEIKEQRGSTSQVERIFSNLPSISYNRPIHEQITCSTETMHYIKTNFTIYHTGYLDESRIAKDKSNRNLSILESHYKEGKAAAYDMFSIANEYYLIEELEKANYYFKQAYERAMKDELWFSLCMYQHIVCLTKLDKYNEAIDLLDEALHQWKEYPEFHTIQALIYRRFGFYDQSLKIFEKSIDIAEKASSNGQDYWLLFPDHGALVPYLRISEIYLERFDIQKYIYYSIKILQLTPSDHTVLFRLVHLLTITESTDAIVQILSHLYEHNNPEHISQLLDICLLAGHKELAEFYYKCYKKHNLPFLLRQQLRYALLMNNTDFFNTMLPEQKIPVQDETIFIIAACIWQDSYYLDFVSAENIEYWPLKEAIESLLNNKPFNSPPVINTIVSLLSELFRLGQFEAYDWLIQQFTENKHEIANQLGDYFFDHFLFDLAVDYYSTIDPNLANTKAYSNLGKLSVHQGFTEDGVEYFSKVIAKNPNKVEIHILRYLTTNNPLKKKQFKAEFILQFPQYKNILFIEKL